MANTEKDPAAVSLGRKGGLARKKKLSAEQRTAIAKKAGKAGAEKRWGTKAQKKAKKK